MDAKKDTGQRRAVFPICDGDVTLIFPERMSNDSIDELKTYLEVFLNMTKQHAATHIERE